MYVFHVSIPCCVERCPAATISTFVNVEMVDMVENPSLFQNRVHHSAGLNEQPHTLLSASRPLISPLHGPSISHMSFTYLYLHVAFHSFSLVAGILSLVLIERVRSYASYAFSQLAKLVIRFSYNIV